MALIQTYAGEALVGSTELDLPSNSIVLSSLAQVGVYQTFLDLSNLTATERYRFRIYEKVQASSTQRILEEVIITGVQSEPVYAAPALALMHGWTFTLQKLQGTDRNISWSIRGL